MEQPVPAADREGLRRVTQAGLLRIEADESIGSLRGLLELIAMGAAHSYNLKIPYLGGLRNTLTAIRVRGMGPADGRTPDQPAGGCADSPRPLQPADHLSQPQCRHYALSSHGLGVAFGNSSQATSAYRLEVHPALGRADGQPDVRLR